MNLNQVRAAGQLMTRRSFTVLSLSSALIASTARAAQGMKVTERAVEIKTADGMCDAFFYHSTTSSYPGIILWTDILGLRQVYRDMGKRLAAEGYAVLVPNPFYRKGKAPVFDPLPKMPDDFPKVMPFYATINAAGAAERDSIAFAAFLDSQNAVSKTKRFGVHAYCMGSLAMRTAAALPERIGAGATFHAGGLVTDKPDSPHLLVPKMKSRFYFGVAADDAENEPKVNDQLKAAFAAAKLPAEIEVYPGTEHGWCVPDSPSYNMQAAERAWSKLLALYKQSVA